MLLQVTAVIACKRPYYVQVLLYVYSLIYKHGGKASFTFRFFIYDNSL